MHSASFFVLCASAALVAAQTTTNVLVGANNTLTFTPNTIQASVGDTITFTFLSKNHTVTQSTFDAPCTNFSATGIDSSFVPVPANATSFQQYSFTLNNASAPLWFYCRQTLHCSKGMVFAINPTAAKNYTAFQAAANATANGGSTPPPGSSGAPPAGGTPTPSSTGAGTTPSSAAVKLGGSAAGLLSLVGLFAGMLL